MAALTTNDGQIYILAKQQMINFIDNFTHDSVKLRKNSYNYVTFLTMQFIVSFFHTMAIKLARWNLYKKFLRGALEVSFILKEKCNL